MKSSITKGSLVRRIGESEIGTVMFLDDTHAGVDYRYEEGASKTGYIPLALLELVSPGEASKPDSRAESKAGP